MRSRKGPPWFQDIPQRARLERGARKAYALKSGCTGRGTSDLVMYWITVPVPEYETRKVTVTLRNTFTPILKSVTADGPTESPHRYDKHRLCMWHPRDAVERRWVEEDGLLKLIVHARLHLFREAWWRETGEWLGDEAPHGPGLKEAA
jgi:hypothetical protein